MVGQPFTLELHPNTWWVLGKFFLLSRAFGMLVDAWQVLYN